MRDPLTTAERVAAHQRRVLEAGGRRISLLLDPETVHALADLRRRLGLPSDTAAIMAAIRRAAARAR